MSSERIEKQILLRAPAERVWRALSDSTEFGSWFGMKFENPFSPGARMAGVILPTTVNAEVAAAQKPYEGTPFELIIESMEPEHLFSFRWHPGAIDKNVDYSVEPATLVAFRLETAADGVMLTVTESGFEQIPLERRAKVVEANEGGWTMAMTLIEAYVGRDT